MTRTVVSIEPLGHDQVIFKLASAPFNVAGAGTNQFLDASEIPQPAGALPIRQIGGTLFTRLGANPAVIEAITQALQTAGPGSYPIAFEISDEDSAALPWESLTIQERFPALEARWPIVRVVTPSSPVPRRAFVPPMRMMAVLSALHRPATEQWEGLLASVTHARTQGFDILLRVLVSEEDLKQIIEDGNHPNVTVQLVPRLSTELIGAIRDVSPQILHFFCHGSVRDGIRRLEFATVTDWDQAESPEAKSTLTLAVGELAEATAGVWLVVLNACEGGGGTSEAYSFAHELVKAGLPAAIGMRRVIDVKDATTFSDAFYPTLFDSFRETLSQGSGEKNLEWSDVLLAARRALRDRHGDPGDNDTWTLPVLYIHPTTFDFVVSNNIDREGVERALGAADAYQTLADLLRSSGAPADLITELVGKAATKAAAAAS